MKVFLDMLTVIETAKDEPFDEGKIEAAKNLIRLGLDNKTIAQATGLNIEENKVEERINKIISRI